MAVELDPSLIDAVKGFEGFSATPAWDYKQYSSGYGTKTNDPNEKIDEATATQRLTDKLGEAAATVNGLNPSMPDGVRNALTSLTYNAGPGWINSGLGELVRQGDWAGAKDRFLQYNKAGGEVNPGLVKRRQQEAAWFDSPPSQGGPPVSPPVQTAALAPPQNIAPTASQIPANAVPGMPQIGLPSAAPQQQAGGQSLFDQMPAQQAAMAGPPQMHRPRVDLTKLRATFQSRPFGGIFYS